MRLSKEEVEHIAHLARLELSEAEKVRYREQLSAVLDYVARLQSLDTSAVEPLSSIWIERSRLRPDAVRPSLTPQELLSNAPQASDDQFRVPPVLE